MKYDPTSSEQVCGCSHQHKCCNPPAEQDDRTFMEQMLEGVWSYEYHSEKT